MWHGREQIPCQGGRENGAPSPALGLRGLHPTPWRREAPGEPSQEEVGVVRIGDLQINKTSRFPLSQTEGHQMD